MTLVKPLPHRTVPDGQLVPHTPIASRGIGVPGGLAQFNGWNTVHLDLSAYGPLYDIGGILTDAYNTYHTTNTRIIIPEGEWTLNSSNFTSPPIGGGQHRGYIAFAGVGMNRTILTKRDNTYSMFIFGGSDDWTPQNGPAAGGYVVGSDLVQGQTSLIIPVAAQSTFGLDHAHTLGVRTKLKFFWQDCTNAALIAAGATPVFHTEYQPYIRCEQVEITSIVGDVVTFYPPILHSPPPGLDCRLFCGNQTENSQFIGLENMSLRVAPEYYNPATDAQKVSFLTQFGDVSSFWILNVEMAVNAGVNYAISLNSVTRFDIRGCYIHGVEGNASNHSLILFNKVYAGFLEDNIIGPGAPCIEINGAAGNLFHANYIIGEVNSNHGPHNFAQTFVRNIFMFEKCDGYFGTCEANTMIGNWAYEKGFADRRFSFNFNFYGNIIASPSYTGAYNLLLHGFGAPYIGGPDPWLDGVDHPHTNLMGGNGTPVVYPADWPHGTPQYIRLRVRESDTVGEWECLGTCFIWENAGHLRVIFESMEGGLNVKLAWINEKRWRASGIGFPNLPAEGTDHQLYAPGADGYGEHNDDVINTMDFRANIVNSVNITGVPPQPLADGDSIWDPLGYTSAPAGDGLDVINWGSCPWFDNGGKQYGFIDRSAPLTVSHRDIPAGRRYTDGTIFQESNQVAMPTFSPVAGSYFAAQNITILCATAGATIHYTTDGSTPTSGSATYSTPIALALPSTTTIKAIAVKATMDDSAVRTGLFTITAPPAVPTAPSNLTVVPLSSTEIYLSWLDNSNNETGFEILHGTDSGVLTLLHTVGPNETTYSHTGLTPATAHFYRVRAVNSTGPSTSTTEETATTNGPGAPPTPTLRSARAPRYAIPGS